MELLLRVVTPDRRQADVAVELATAARVGELSWALWSSLSADGRDRPSTVTLARDGSMLPAGATIDEVELVSGDVVELVSGDHPACVEHRNAASRPTPLEPAGIVRIDVVAGPDCGASVELQTGRSLIGRALDGSVVLTDPTVSRQQAIVTVVSSDHVELACHPAARHPVLVDGVGLEGCVPVGFGQVIAIGRSRLVVRPAGDAQARPAGSGTIDFQPAPYRCEPRRAPITATFADLPRRSGSHRLQVAVVLAPLVAGLVMYAFSRQAQFLVLTLISPLAAVGSIIDDRRHGRRARRRELLTVWDRATVERLRVQREARAELERRRRAAPDLAELIGRARRRSPDLWSRRAGATDFLAVRLGTRSDDLEPTLEFEPGADPALIAALSESLHDAGRIDESPLVVDLGAHRVVAVHGDPIAVDRSVAALLAQLATLHSPDDLVLQAIATRPELTAAVRWLPHAGAGQASADPVHTLVVVDDRLGTAPRSAADLLDATDRHDRPLTVVWIARDAASVPRQAALVVAAGGEGGARLWSASQPALDGEFRLEQLAHDRLDLLVRSLAPLRDSSSTGRLAVPGQVELLDVLGPTATLPDQIRQSWERQAQGLAVALGCGPSGTFEVDLERDGPHALIAGTSGAGKSELLQTLVVGLAAGAAPSRLNFLFVDYKGGASTIELASLPHCVGSVTNLTPGLAARCLVSLRAELRRRMALLDGRAKDLDELRSIDPAAAPASLVIVVDEFATLVKEAPEFMAGMVDIAQRGRSLGVHLVLATQRPAGVVDDNILANTNLRIALRLLERSESTGLVGVPHAAELPTSARGRGYVRIGTGDPVQVQVAFGGAPLRDAAPAPIVRLIGDRGLAPFPEADQVRTGSTQLDAVLDAIRSAGAGAAGAGVPSQRPWRPPLGPPIQLAALLDELGEARPAVDSGHRAAQMMVPIGRLDQPDRQSQPPLVVDLRRGNGLLLIGGPQCGKTTALAMVATAIRSVAGAATAVCGLDFGGGELAARLGQGSSSTATIAVASDIEQVTRLLAGLSAEIEHRTAQRTTHPAPIVCLIDGLAAAYEAMSDCDGSTAGDAWTERLTALLCDASRVGVYAVAATDRRQGIPARVITAIANRLVLRLSDDLAATEWGVPASVMRQHSLADGQAIWAGEVLAQLAVADPVEVAVPAASVVPSPLPDRIAVAEITAQTGGRPPIGITDVTGEQASLPADVGDVLVVGPRRSGRSAALATIAASLQPTHDVHRLAAKGMANGARSASGLDHVAAALDRITNLLAMGAPVRPIAVVVDDLDLLDAGCLAPRWEALAAERDVSVVAAISPHAVTGYSLGALLARLRHAGNTLVLQPDDPGEFLQLTGVRLRTRPGLEFPPGRGVLVGDRAAVVIQVAQLEPAESDVGRRLAAIA